MLWHALPAFEELQTAWEAKLNSVEFFDYHPAINNGLDKLKKYYLCFNKKPCYILALGKFSSIFTTSSQTDCTSSSSILQACIHTEKLGWCSWWGRGMSSWKPQRNKLAGWGWDGIGESGTFCFSFTAKWHINIFRWNNTGKPDHAHPCVNPQWFKTPRRVLVHPTPFCQISIIIVKVS